MMFGPSPSFVWDVIVDSSYQRVDIVSDKLL